MKIRLIASTILTVLAGLLLPLLVWYQQVPYAEHAARFQVETLDWVVIVGGSILWAVMAFGSFLTLKPVVKTNRNYALINLAVTIIVIVIGIILAKNSIFSSPVALLIGYTTMLLPAMYFAVTQKPAHPPTD